MKKYILPTLKLTLVLIILCAIIYPALILGIARLAAGKGEGVSVSYHGKVVGYELIGQRFTSDNYFWGRPSAVNFNASGSGASNKGPSNPEFLATLKSRVDSFVAHNPGIKKDQIPVDLITASGSGLDPDISIQAARIQVPRIAKTRNISEDRLYELIDGAREKPLFGIFGEEKVNVLKLNVALDMMKSR